MGFAKQSIMFYYTDALIAFMGAYFTANQESALPVQLTVE